MSVFQFPKRTERVNIKKEQKQGNMRFKKPYVSSRLRDISKCSFCIEFGLVFDLIGHIFCWEELNWWNWLWKCFCWEVHSWQTMTRCTQGLWERQRLHQWDSLPWQVERWIQNKAQNIGYWNVYKIKPTPYKDAQKAQWVKAALARKRVSTGGVQSKA